MSVGEPNQREVNLLIYENHYFVIRNFNRLLRNKKNSNYFCVNCLNGFTRQITLTSHQQLCLHNKPQRLSMPSDLNLKFKNFNKCVKHRYAVYADFECLLSKISTTLPDPSKSFTSSIEKHIPVSFAFVVVDHENDILYHKYYAGEHIIEIFFSELKAISLKLLRELKRVNKIEVDDITSYSPYRCVFCREFFDANSIRVRHHSHDSNHVLGLAHQLCNLLHKKTFFIPVIIHNSRNYDSHLLLKHLPPHIAKDINIIPVNIEKFTMFTLDHLKFLDSYQFLDASLDALVNNLNVSNHNFPIFDAFFAGEDNRYLLKRKGVFPYSFLDNLSKLSVTTFPSKAQFFNVLTQTHISDEDYSHAQMVYNTFGCTTMEDYLKLYQYTDVLLLAEVFTNFRKLSLTNYELDPIHYISLSELTFDAGLKHCKIELKLLSHVNDYLFFESHMRGGICLVGKRFAQANNPYIADSYDRSIDHSYILALDCVNLYGYAMSMSLPFDHFAWMTPEEIQTFDIFRTTPDSPQGFILEVDLEIPSALHNEHNDLPMAAEHLNISYDMLSPYSKRLCDHFQLKNTLPAKKLTPNFYPKKNYVVHYLNLLFYLKQGLILRKTHRILVFSQKPWLKEYIDYNNEKRNTCNTVTEKLFFKKMNNAFFGKTMQNVRKRINVRGALTQDVSQKLLSSPCLEYFEPINENFTLFKMRKPNLYLDKPIYIGFCVLELSKLRMYDLYYNNFKNFYKNSCDLLYMDTDSLYLHIRTANVYADLK
ncbi:c2H2-type domain-containing protein, partial [Nephila pilipes]